MNARRTVALTFAALLAVGFASPVFAAPEGPTQDEIQATAPAAEPESGVPMIETAPTPAARAAAPRTRASKPAVASTPRSVERTYAPTYATTSARQQTCQSFVCGSGRLILVGVGF